MRAKFGIASTAMMPMIPITTINSTNVKPEFLFFFEKLIIIPPVSGT
jgi:hypothetical protein